MKSCKLTSCDDLDWMVLSPLLPKCICWLPLFKEVIKVEWDLCVGLWCNRIIVLIRRDISELSLSTLTPCHERAMRGEVRKVMGARWQAAMWVRVRTLASTFCDFTTTGGSWSGERSPLTWAHTSSLWLLSWKSIEGKQNHTWEAIAKIRWNITVAWKGGVAKVVTGGQKILDVLWR